MPTYGPVTLSDSLVKLLAENTKKSKCIKILYDVLLRLQSGAQAKGDCPCPECRKARKKTVLLNDKLIGDFFSFREAPGKISYMPKGKTQAINEDGTWVRRGRVEISPVKWIKSMLHPKISAKLKDHEFSPFGDILKAEEEAQRINFEFVDFEDAYNSAKYGDSLPDSCMWGKPVGEFYRLMGAKALVAVNGKGQYKGRAVFWPNVRTSQGKLIQLVDRIYASKEITELFKDYARKEGYHWKYKQNRSNLKDVVSPDEDVHSWGMSVEGDLPEGNEDLYYPFLDTFQGGKDLTAIINDPPSELKGVIYCYATTNGVRDQIEDHSGQVMTHDGRWIPDADAIYVEGYGTQSRNDHNVVQCGHSENWYRKSDCVYLRHKRFWVCKSFMHEYPAPDEEKPVKERSPWDASFVTEYVRTSTQNFTWQPIAIDPADFFDPETVVVTNTPTEGQF